MPPGVQRGNSSRPDIPSNWRPMRPNMLVTGTPGVGKSTFAKRLAEEMGLRHVDVGEFARDRNLLGDHDALHEAFYMDEDGVLDELEPTMATGGVILDHHSCDWYPERWIQLVLVLRAGTEALYDRLEGRGYSKRKLDENIQAEIMQVVLEEAVQAYPQVRVVQLKNETEQDREQNISTVKQAWRSIVEDEQGEPSNQVR